MKLEALKVCRIRKYERLKTFGLRKKLCDVKSENGLLRGNRMQIDYTLSNLQNINFWYEDDRSEEIWML